MPEWSDPTVLAVTIALGFALLIAALGILVMLARWIFRINPIYESMQTIEKQLSHMEELLSAMRSALNDMEEKAAKGPSASGSRASASGSSTPAAKPEDTHDLERLLSQVPAKKPDRPVTARVIRSSGILEAAKKAGLLPEEKKEDGWDEALRRSGGAEEEAPPMVEEGRPEPLPETVKEPGGLPLLEELDEDGAPAGRSGKARDTRVNLPPHVPSVVSVEEVAAALGDQEETSSEMPAADPMRVMGKRVDRRAEGEVVTAHILVAKEAAPTNEREFSSIVNKSVRIFFDEYPHAYSIMAAFYSERKDKYLLLGTYEWTTHTSPEGGVKELWRLGGTPDKWKVFEKSQVPWKK